MVCMTSLLSTRNVVCTTSWQCVVGRTGRIMLRTCVSWCSRHVKVVSYLAQQARTAPHVLTLQAASGNCYN